MSSFGTRLSIAGGWILALGVAVLLITLLAQTRWEQSEPTRHIEALNNEMEAELDAKDGRPPNLAAVRRESARLRMTGEERYGTWRFVGYLAAGFGAICLVVGWAAAGASRPAGSKKPDVQPADAGSETNPG